MIVRRLCNKIIGNEEPQVWPLGMAEGDIRAQYGWVEMEMNYGGWGGASHRVTFGISGSRGATGCGESFALAQANLFHCLVSCTKQRSIVLDGRR
jgi:hypothetical protein